MHAKGIAARKAEKARLKQMKEMMKGLALIFAELNIPIPDPEAEWKATNATWQAIEAKKTVKKNPPPCRTEEGEKISLLMLMISSLGIRRILLL